MSIASAIAALNPSIWYKLDTVDSTVEDNQGTQNNNGTYSGSYEQGVPGPEEGTFATRLYSTGQVVSGVMDLSTFVGQTLAMWVSTDASGLINTQYPCVGIGDPANRGARGPLISEQHNTQGTPTWFARYGGIGSLTAGTPQPLRFWHWVVYTMATGTNGSKLYMDGQQVTQTTMITFANPLATDPLLIRCDEPVVIAHVCWWGGVLSQTQIQSVAAELPAWPYDLPINLPPPDTGGGGGGLTEGQAGQLTHIETLTSDIPGLVDASTYISSQVNMINGKVDEVNAKVDDLLSNWAGYTGVTLPSLQDMLNTMLAAVTAQIGSGVDTVEQTIGQIFSLKPQDWLGTLSLSDGVTCEHLDLDLSLASIYGIVLTLTSWPEDTKWRTPDQEWSLRDLATIRFERGGDTIMRHGIHTKSHVISPIPSWPLPWLGPIPTTLQPLGLHVIVDFLPGVCGELTGFQLPY